MSAPAERVSEAEKELVDDNPLGAIELLAPLITSKSIPDRGRWVLGIAQFRIEEFAEAEDTFDTLLEDGRDDAAILYYLGLSRERLGKLAGAKQAYRLVLEVEPEHELANEKLDTLESEGEMLARTKAARRKSDEPKFRQYDLPSAEDEEAYLEAMKRQISAERRANWAIEPLWTKLLAVAVIVGVLAMIIFGPPGFPDTLEAP